ncbi:hypothetical protein [Actinacidiphila sp. ITFR-21]|nr:hypothetical protein [Streptomyces sp. ITFR-21]WNI15895.1 hypothetical protein RLT57_10430 [Streptomyces sp. ITFR-21]
MNMTRHRLTWMEVDRGPVGASTIAHLGDIAPKALWITHGYGKRGHSNE